MVSRVVMNMPLCALQSAVPKFGWIEADMVALTNAIQQAKKNPGVSKFVSPEHQDLLDSQANSKGAARSSVSPWWQLLKFWG